MKSSVFEEVLDGLCSKSMGITEVYRKCQNEIISYEQAEQILYCMERDKRFELFIALYEATLKDNPITAFKVFREAYCSSDHIFMQIKNSSFSFSIKVFLRSSHEQGFNFLDLINKEERAYYDVLPESFTIYRGLNEEEHKSKDYGISWSLNKETAEAYSYFDKNSVAYGKGGLVSKVVDKKEVLAVFSVHSEYEIIHIS